MAINKTGDTPRLEWIEPEIQELDVLETFARPTRGADVRGNPYVDCQRS